jgi:hypothetical protein
MSDQLDSIIASAPVYHNNASYDRAGILEAMQAAGIAPDSIVAVSQCQFGTANIEALVDANTIAFVHPTGVLCSVGKRKMMGKTVKFKTIDFGRCRGFGAVEYTDDRGFGKFGIEFGGPGNVLLGRLHWAWRAKRFRDASEEIMAVAEERDRILNVVSDLMS